MAPGLAAYRPPPDLKPADLLVVLYTPHYFGPGFEASLDLEPRLGVPVRCRFTRDRARLAEADAVLFHLPHLQGEALPERRSGQRWVLMSMESEARHPGLADPELRGRFDWTASYRLDSDVPSLYLNDDEYEDFALEPLPPAARDAAPALFIASHAVPERDAWVAELMEHLPVASPGRCLNNRRVPGFAEGGAPAALEQIRRHRFFLAFENSRCTDYVTEKLFRPLAVGAVPVYRGAPNVREFLPDPDAAILADDFDGPRALARHLLTLCEDEVAFERHLAWRRRPRRDRFETLLGVGSVEARMRLAVKLAHGCERDCPCGGRLRDLPSHPERLAP